MLQRGINLNFCRDRDRTLLTKLKNYDAHVPNIYGAPKVHKPNCPLRPIVNNRPSPTYALSKWLAQQLKIYQYFNENEIVNSYEFKEDIIDMKLNGNQRIISLDVESMPIRNKILNSLKNGVYYFKRYVDDYILFINQGSEQKILDTFNNLLPDINYSMEVDNNKSINFLDMNLSYSNNNITTSIYKKPTHTGTYWNFSSQNHFSQKVGLVKALIYRAFTLINDTTKRNIEINNIKKELINEDFPIKLINRIIEDMNQKYENNTLIQNLKCKNKEAKFITLPFINQKFARNLLIYSKILAKNNMPPIVIKSTIGPTGEKLCIIEASLITKILDKCGIEYKLEETVQRRELAAPNRMTQDRQLGASVI
ncbi:hypothetical protein LAZ67_20001544 [Cordylochernes scorpioides]|uniref:Helix-turn-helix domain-containing protein n=1 Tax=Cordylochernes scorpioides TaxID=51811 RepID=A0ABY6LPB1_9ARAC|nr:hypothetical protein LAZ67_20001544 [Cordylochernes scorpioides]